MNACDPADLIRPDWRVNGRVYHDPDVFRVEQERVFRRTWLYLAHESELANPGDYKTTYAGSQPVIVSRGSSDGQIHAMLNRCRHRAAAVCTEPAGTANYFRCAYHGWTYKNDGRLNGVPYRDGYPELPKDDLGLIKMPRVASFAGFVFGSFAEDGPSLEEHLGNARRYLEIVAQQGPDGIRLSAGAHRYEYEANWKLQVENTIDNYHFGFVHRSFIEVLTDRLGEAPPIRQNIQDNPEWRTIDLGQGHSVHEFGDPETGNNEGRLGDLPFNLIIFPNLCFVGAQLRLINPRGVDRTAVELYPMLHEGASDEHNAEILRVHEGFYGPAGFGGPDDVEVAFERVNDGLAAREHDWLLFTRGFGSEQAGPDGTLIGHAADEVPQRALYKQWARLMGAESGVAGV